MTVKDVKYSIDRCADTSNGDPLVSAFSLISDVSIPDEQTIVITLTEPNTEFLSYLTTAIVPEGSDDLDVNPVGTGPFRFVSRSPQENLILERFDDYWGDPAYLDEVEFRIIADADMLVTDLQSGAIDMALRLTTTQAEQLGEGFHIEEGTMNLVQALYLNHEVEPLDQLKVRQALNYAVNREEILDLMADGKGVIVGSSMYPGLTAYYEESLASFYETDIDKAKELLKEAGYPDGFDLTVTVSSADQPHIDTAQILAEQLKQIGVNVEIELVEWETWLADVYAGREYEATVVGVDAANLSARAMLERFTSDNPGNFINYQNDTYDETFEAAISVTDEETQIRLYQELEEILTKDAANVYIQDMANLVAIRDGFEGYVFYPLYVQDMAAIYRVE